MAISLNGTSQYATVGSAGANLLSTLPLSIFAVIDSTNLKNSNLSLYNSIFSHGDWGDRGYGLEITDESTPHLYFWQGITTSISTVAITKNTGWYLVGACYRANGNVDFYAYRYNTGALTVATSTGFSTSPSAPGGSDTILIGAELDGTPDGWFGGKISWCALFSGDLGNAASTNSAPVLELIDKGPWGMLDSNCELFAVFNGTAQDFSSNKNSISLAGSPSFVAGIYAEAPSFTPSAIFFPSGGTSVLLKGTASAQSGGSGSLSVVRKLSGTAPATSGGSGSLKISRFLRGTAAVLSGASGSLGNTAPGILLKGTAPAISAASGSLAVSRKLSGTAAAQSSGSGSLKIVRKLSGTAPARSGGSGRFFTLLRTRIAVQDITRLGLAPTYTAAISQGHSINNNDETFLHIKNTSGVSVTVTIQKVVLVRGLADTPKSLTVPASGEFMVGPFPHRIYGDDLTVDYSATSGVSLAAFRPGLKQF